MASLNSSVPPILNPYTPLAYLPPSLANQLQILCYLFVATLSAFVYDWLMAMPDEYRMIRKGEPLSIPIIAYFLSRLGTLGYCTTATVYRVAAVADCQALLYVTTGFVILAEASTALLFLIRLKAIYSDSKFIPGFFGFMWVANLGVSILIPLRLHGEHIGPTKRCIDTGLHPLASVPISLDTAYIILIFLAISYRLVSYTIDGDTWKARMKCFVSGDGLPRLSKGLLQSGQLYFFTTVGFTITQCILVFAPNVPPLYQTMLSVPGIALENVVACFIFRSIRLDFIKDPRTTSVFMTTRPLSRLHFASENETRSQNDTLGDSRNLQVNVEMTKTTDIEAGLQEDYLERLDSSGHPSDWV